MALLGQASGGFTESSSALRILHVGVRNTIGQLSADSFTQSNPPIVPTQVTDAPGLLTNVLGVLSGSVAFARADEGANFHGGPTDSAQQQRSSERPLGVFINNASGNAFENTPAVASNRGPYVSAQGTYANRLYETKDLANNGNALTYQVGDILIPSVNGFLTNLDDAVNSHSVAHGQSNAGATLAFAILKVSPDSTSDELVYDQRI
tara:strand:- start:56 stop:676 length:621 start_codon:yes stop_codon:yes gene_type:complete